MEYNEIKRLMDDVGDSKIDSLEIEFPDGTKINMKKNTEIRRIGRTSGDSIQTTYPENEPCQNQNETITQPKKTIKSPMVGTFYSKSSPDKEPFVKIGDKIKKGDTLCIIEAMKLMNEIQSDQEGEIIEILLKDGEIVDYGKELFILK